MKRASRFFRAALVAAWLVFTAPLVFGAGATIGQQLIPAQVAVGERATLTLTIQDPTLGNQVRLPTVDLSMPQIEGLQENLMGTSISVAQGNAVTSLKYVLVPMHSGTFTIPDFLVRTRSGAALQVRAVTLRVTENGGHPVVDPSNKLAQVLQILTTGTAAPATPRGPVVMPPSPPPSAPADGSAPPADNPADTTPDIQTPRDPDGSPAKVFIIITPQTTNAYVGQAVPMTIDFFIRMDVNSDQNSLPTIKGSDFLMNSFTNRGRVTLGIVGQEQYLRESWVTSISAPKSGDFPLSMQRDTYWVKSLAPPDNSIFGNFFNRRANLAHEMIGSNLLTMHIQALPEEGRPPHFTGAIGQLTVTGEATPNTVAVGEPVHLRFSVSGEGNFDYVRSPFLKDDPAWKAYIPTTATRYVDESHVHALKAFDQSVIPQKGGVLALPEADFSYFDPVAKQYVTVPLKLPDIVVTGTALPPAPVSPDADENTTTISATTPLADMLPNRLEIGSTRTDLTPAFLRPWFWALQVGFVALPLGAALVVLLRFRSSRDREAQTLRVGRERSRQQDEDAMAAAVRQGDARGFFLAARHAVQTQLGAQWQVAPEALTLREIRARDPQLAETLEPLFRQADEAIYSGNAVTAVDLAQWEQRVRTELLQPQPA